MTTLGPWAKGMNNRAADHALPEGAARNIVNADVDNSGKARRRKGFTKVYDGLNTKGGYSCPLGRYFVEAGKLKKFTATNTAETVYSGITGSTFAHAYFNGVMYFSDGVINLKVTDAGAVKWGMAVPSSLVVSSASGAYGAGTYLAACCWVDADGVESGASEIVSITVGADTGFVFSSLPTSSDPQVAALRLYLSTANGKELYHVADTTSNTYSLLSGRYDEGNILDNHFISPPPPGRIIRFHNGRAYIADDLGNVFYSEPFQYDHFNPADNYLQFPAPVDVMEPVTDGIFFAHNNVTDFYTGEPEDGFTVINAVLPYGGVYGTGKKMPDSGNVCWQSQRGMVIGAPGGSVQNIQEANVATESAASGATLIKEKDGLRQFIAALHQPTTSPLAATSWIDAEITRRS